MLTPWFITSGAYETELSNFFASVLKTDSHCIDVGANFGYFTVLMGRICNQGKVIGIEPDERIFNIARDNVLINGFWHANVIHAAAGKEASEMILYRRNSRSGNTSMAKMPDDFIDRMGEAPSESFVVKCMPIDDLLPKLNGRVDFIKIDVEGAEPLVFEGAAKTIASNPNIIIVMEWSPSQIMDAGFEISGFLVRLEEMRLKPFQIKPDGLAPLSFKDLATLPYQSGIVFKRVI